MNKDFISEEHNSNDEENQSGFDSENENQHEMDPEHIEFLQNQFQDEIVDGIFENIVEYIRETAIPLCEFMSKDDIEVIIDELQSCQA
jgi:hypothetical protein